MARATRIISITDLPDGRLEIAYTAGPPPLPAGQSGAITYSRRRDVEEAIFELEASLTDQQLLLFHMAIKWMRADGTFKPRAQVEGTTMTLDMLAVKVLDVV